MLGPACPIPAKNVHYVETLETTMANRWSIQLTISRLLKKNFSCWNKTSHAPATKFMQPDAKFVKKSTLIKR